MNSATNTIIAFCARPDEASASRIAETLVAERLAACVNRLPGVVSTYRWEDRVCSDHEHLLLIKTTLACFEAMCARILALHPYDLPEVIAVDIHAGLPAYLHWLMDETQT